MMFFFICYFRIDFYSHLSCGRRDITGEFLNFFLTFMSASVNDNKKAEMMHVILRPHVNFFHYVNFTLMFICAPCMRERGWLKVTLGYIMLDRYLCTHEFTDT